MRRYDEINESNNRRDETAQRISNLLYELTYMDILIAQIFR